MSEKTVVDIYNIFAIAVNQNYVKQLRDFRKYDKEPSKYDRQITLNDMFNLVHTITKSLIDNGESGDYSFDLLAFDKLENGFDDYFTLIHDERGMTFELKEEFDKDLRNFYQEYSGQSLEQLEDCTAGVNELLGVFPVQMSEAFYNGVQDQLETYCKNGMDDNPSFVDVQ